jgi:uncharacterized protein
MMTDRIEANKAIASRVLDALGRGDLDAVLGVASEDFEYWMMSATIQKYSKALLIKTMKDFSSLMERWVSFTVVGTTAEGDRVAVEAEGDGLTVAGKAYRNRYHFVFEFRGGTLARIREYMDTAYAAQILSGG